MRDENRLRAASSSLFLWASLMATTTRALLDSTDTTSRKPTNEVVVVDLLCPLLSPRPLARSSQDTPGTARLSL